MAESLLSIGAFSRAAGLSASALRFYDEVGLLPAAQVDPVSGYRYYDSTQQAQARLLAVLREAEVPVETMRGLLRADADQRAQRLVTLADDILAQARRKAEAVRGLAGATAGPARVSCWVDSRQAADAVERVAALAGQAPFDAVLVEARDGVLALLATDRYRLARFTLTTTAAPAGHGRCLLGPGDWEAVREALAGAGVHAHVELDGGELRVDGSCRAGRPADGFADLWSLQDCYDAEATQHLAWPGDVQDDTVALGGDVVLGEDLARGAATTLLGGPVQVRAAGRGRPVVLSCVGHPAHTVAVMPLRRG